MSGNDLVKSITFFFFLSRKRWLLATGSGFLPLFADWMSSGQEKRRRLVWPLHLLAGWVAAKRRRVDWSKDWPLLVVAAERRRLDWSKDWPLLGVAASFGLAASPSSGQSIFLNDVVRRLDWPLHLLAGWVAAERRRLGWSKNWPLVGVAAKRRRLECQ